MGGQWEKWPRARGWSLDFGHALRGDVVPQEKDFEEQWSASVNSSFIGCYKHLEEAKLHVEKVIRRDMRQILEDWQRFCGCADATPETTPGRKSMRS